jgi:hypothetical protein
MILNKIKTILLSRIKHNKEEEWVKRRVVTCLECNYNTLNGGSLKGYRFFLVMLSSLYSKLMGRSKEDVYGNCSACSMCSIYFKAFEPDEMCIKNKWERLEDGSLKLEVFKERKKQKVY